MAFFKLFQNGSIEIKLKKGSLSFTDPVLEEKYVRSIKEETLAYIRTVIFISVFFYAFFALLDAYLIPELKYYFWFIRFALIIPFSLLTLIISKFNFFKKSMYSFLTFLSLSAGMGIIAMILISYPPVSNIYYAGLILVLLYNYNFLKLPFLLASVIGIILILMYIFAAVYLQQLQEKVLISNCFFLISANFFSMFSNFLIEYYSRKNFLLKYQLKIKSDKIQSNNSNLELEVEERTRAQQKAYDKLNFNEKYYRHVLNNLGEGVGIVDKNETFIYVNTAAEKIFGTSPGKLTGRGLAEFSTPESISTINSQTKLRSHGKSSHYEYEFVSETKERGYLLVTATPEYNEEGDIVGTIGIFRDITDQKKMENELRLRLNYETLLSSISNKFVGVYDFSDKVMESLAEFGKFIKATHGFLYEIKPKENSIEKTYNWSEVNTFPEMDMAETVNMENIPHIINKMNNNELVDLKADADSEFISEKLLLFNNNTKTNSIIIPVRVNNDLVAITGFNYYIEQCLWSENFIALIRVLADIFGYVYERKRNEFLIHNQLQEKEYLLKEVHHRVKNNMQIISSIIRLQTRFLKNINVNDILANFQNRIQSMYLAYNKVFLSEGLNKIDLETYLSTLIKDVYYNLNVSKNRIEIKQNIDWTELDINLVIPLGLIINEVLSNSLKHAFPEDKSGNITIVFKHLEENEYLLEIADNGIGISEKFNFIQAESLGALLIHVLCSQLKAEFKIENKNGTAFSLKFKDTTLKTFTKI